MYVILVGIVNVWLIYNHLMYVILVAIVYVSLIYATIMLNHISCVRVNQIIYQGFSR